MVKMTMNKPVNYSGTHYPSNTPFDVEDRDVLDLKGKGAHIIEQEKVVDEEKPVKKTTKKKPAVKTQEKPVSEK